MQLQLQLMLVGHIQRPKSTMIARRERRVGAQSFFCTTTGAQWPTVAWRAREKLALRELRLQVCLRLDWGQS